MTILICDDNYAVHESLKTYLQDEGFHSVSAYDGEEALRILSEQHIDLVVLDIMLPGLSGMDVMKRIRATNNIPICMLSALGSENNRINGLQFGADDYITKPFSPKEVVIRISKLLNRSLKAPKKILKFAELSVDLSSYTVTISGENIPVTASEVKTLAYLITNAETVISRERILNEVWGYEYVGDTRAVDAQIKRIRKKTAGRDVHFRIQSVYGIGFKLEMIK